MNVRMELTPKQGEKRTFLPPAYYTLSKEEKKKVCNSLLHMKVPTGYSSNLLPVAIRGVLPKHVRFAGSMVVGRKKKTEHQEQKGQEVHGDEEHNGKEVQVDEEQKMSGSLDTSSTRSTRGRTQMHKLDMQRVQGVKKEVQFNALVQPIGKSATELQSYIHVLAREKVKLNFKTWKHVPQDIKDKIWNAVNLSFIVPAQFKKNCLSSANDKWQQYKTQLTNNFIWKRLNDEENLHKPPAGYDIMGDEWTQFVIIRMSEDFKKLSEQQKLRRKKNLYPHRLARKGYARLASEISTELRRCFEDKIYKD
ncbi:PREDICTED: uncharacterized protein LOC109155026 isoform X2 [Ipomoea nil]|uniref:uncharacterized protein LOC109155026 isoform X2 n=1 Tax=Ipomoea nil TaxID=35883 RepID=UPI000900C49C|nr:PREDICTED: uncharacterized protein LOC109155026 isoform X2 [Ipomoea nil]